MANNTISVAAGDDKTEINFTLKDSAGSAINLTGMTIRFAIRAEGATSNTNNSNNTCTITSAATGQFKYSFVATDLPAAGVYRGQLKLTFADSKSHLVPVFVYLNCVESFF